MEPTRDDLELTLKELQGQLLQTKLSAVIYTGAIKEIERRLRDCPPSKEVKDERPAGVN